MSRTHYGAGGRLSRSADIALVNSAYAHDCKDGAILLPYLSEANQAHLLTLFKAGVIPKEHVRIILNGLLELENYAIDDFIVSPSNGDIYNNFDVNLVNIIGSKAGWLHAGRPRREAMNVAFLIKLRKVIIQLIDTSVSFLNVFISISRRHTNSLMIDYTYLHHAQPTTLGHYILTFAFGLDRDLSRLFELYERINLSPGESGSVNGSRLKLDRRYFSNLLGFKNISSHCRDAMWQPDIPYEVISKVAGLCMNIARFAEELQIWNSKEFNYIELPDKYCRASVIMPQKKNPYPLTYFRGLTNKMIGKVSSYGSYGRVFSGNPDSRIFIYGDLIDSIDSVDKGVHLLANVLKETKFHQDVMARAVITSDTFATDLADELLILSNVDYREIHHIIGRSLRRLIESGKNASDLTLSILDNEFLETVGHISGLSSEKLNDIKSPKSIVMSRDVPGGAAPDRVLDMLAILDNNCLQYRNRNIKNKVLLKDGVTFRQTEIQKIYE